MNDKQKGNSKARTVPTAPADMHQVDTDLDAFPAHDFDKVPVLSGTVVKVKDLQVTDRRTGELRDTAFAVIKTADGNVKLWKSANLGTLFEALAPGVTIWVDYDGMEELYNGNRMRHFNAYHD